MFYDRNLRMNYVTMPILIHSYLFSGFSVKAGIEPTLLVSAKVMKYNSRMKKTRRVKSLISMRMSLLSI